jgi:hypothetical protein
MALGQPTLTVTINAVAKVLNRIADDGYTSEYLLRGTLDEFRVKIRHSSYTDAKRGVVIERHNVELTQTIYPVSPSTKSTVRKAYLVLENETGDAGTDLLNFDLGFVGVFTSTHITELNNWIS